MAQIYETRNTKKAALTLTYSFRPPESVAELRGITTNATANAACGSTRRCSATPQCTVPPPQRPDRRLDRRPDEFDDVRVHRKQAKKPVAAAATPASIARLCRERCTLRVDRALIRGNAATPLMPPIAAWCALLDALGICSVRLHVLEVDDPAVRARLYASMRAWPQGPPLGSRCRPC